MNFFKTWKFKLLAFAFFCYSLFQLISPNNGLIRSNFILDQLFTTITAPLFQVSNNVYNLFYQPINKYNNLQAANKQIKNLETRIEEYQWNLSSLTNQVEENKRLKLLLDFGNRFDQANPTFATITYKNSSSDYKSIRINKGTNHNISIGDAVLAPNMFMGTVYKVFPNYADVLLVIDPNHSVSVLSKRSRFRVRLRGDTYSNYLKLEHALLDADLEVGDILLTSTLNESIPSLIPVGIIKSITRDQKNSFLKGTVEPYKNLNAINYVVVIQQIKELQDKTE